ncbi:hypothetical protein P4S72_16840 [Vibrio sp. PP-XX7]
MSNTHAILSRAHQYARLHLPVAPACNIQCNYCNRKYDCSNESRPGVVSQLVDPATALQTVSGPEKTSTESDGGRIAGPGDALANPQATFCNAPGHPAGVPANTVVSFHQWLNAHPLYR